jgi:hypothetical protein
VSEGLVGPSLSLCRSERNRRRDYFTLSLILVLFVSDPLVAVTVKCELPVAAPAPLVRVSVDEPGDPTACGLKLAVTPEGNPEAAKATDELNPPSALDVTLSVPFAVDLTVMLVALGVRENPGTFTVTMCFCVAPAPVAATVAE